MAKKKNTYKKVRKEGMEMIAKALIIPKESFDKFLEAMIKEEKQKTDNKKKGED